MENETVYRVTPEEAGRKVRDILRRSMCVSYSAMKSAKWDGRILVDGVPVHVDRPVAAGETVCFRPAEAAPAFRVKPYDLALDVPWEDEHLLVVDKPAPLASQSGRKHPDDSLENALFAYLGCPDNYIYRPVNRLDRGTSGLMVVARSAYAQHLLQRQLHTPAFRRIYLALTEGIPPEPEGVLDFPLGKADEASVCREVRADGKPARTRYRVLAAAGGRALVRLELETGRTHQIRVHLSHIGCPVAGDFLYGTELPEEFPGRFALHSAELILRHPVTGQELRLRSDPPWPVLSMDGH